MLRAAAKNHDFLTVLCDPLITLNLPVITATWRHKFCMRERLAAKTFARTAAYDSAISGWMASRLGHTFPT